MEYLVHHGIKGQEWGVRRYQNKDGSLTEEGRRRYGYNKSGISENTKERIKQGSKIGAAIGSVVGTGAAGLTLGTLGFQAAMLGVSLNPAGAVMLGGSIIASYAASGALRGTLVGAIYGSTETRAARKILNNKNNTDVKMKDLKES